MVTSSNGNGDFSEIREILRSIAQRQDRFQDQLEFGSTVEDDRAEHDQVDSELRVDVNDNSQRIQVLIGESRENIREHRAFRERFDRMLNEIQRIWQRFAS